MISKVLVANRGEIAIRAFRAAYEMGIATVAVYPYEDRNSLHRLKADESYQIGEKGHPVRAYLSVDEIIRVAQQAGADAVYPGYGFLSENPDLAAACAAAGITFVGPGAEILELTGNKSRAIAAARAAGLPVLNSSAPSSSADELMAAAATMEFPLFVKAVSGGGGRGMRRVTDLAALPEAIEAASREAESAFGDPTLYLEQAVLNPRHIEVQILADTHGNVMHLFERDCSVQRRHQKVIELAPAPNLPDELRAEDLRRRGRVRPSDRLHLRGHRRIPARRARPLRVHRDESAHPGRAHRHRGDHRRRPGRQPDAHRRRRDAGGPWAEPGPIDGARCRFAVPDHHRGPGQRLPPRHRPHHWLPNARRRGDPAGRRLASGRRDQRPLRLDAGQADLSRARLRYGGGPGAPRARRVPDPGRVDEHPVPAGGGQRSRLPRRTRHHLIHRRAAVSADCADPCRPWHQDPQLPRRCHCQPAARAASVDGVPAGQTARDRPRRGAAARQQAPADRGGAGGIRSLATRIQVRRCHRHDVPRCASVAAGHPRSHHRPADGRALHRADDAAAAVHRVLGRRDLRCGASVLEGGPVGAAGRAARGDAQHLPADAAARPQHRRLHAVSRNPSRTRSSKRRQRLVSTSTASSTRSTTSTRCGRRSTRCAKPARRWPKSR